MVLIDIVEVLICSRCEALALSRNPKAVHMGATSHSGYLMKVETYKSGYTGGYRVVTFLTGCPKGMIFDCNGDIEVARLQALDSLRNIHHIFKTKKRVNTRNATVFYFGKYRTFCEEFENMESVQFFDVSSSNDEVKEWSEHISNKIKEYEKRQTK